jgi:hypothetical protein
MFESIVLITGVSVLCLVWLLVAAHVWHFLHLKNAYFGGTASMFICKQWLIPFRHFAETLAWHLPGGDARKAAFIRHRMKQDREGYTHGRAQLWSHQEVLEKRLYHECAADTLERPIDFVRMHLAIFFWPFVVLCVGVLLSTERGRRYVIESGLLGDLL